MFASIVPGDVVSLSHLPVSLPGLSATIRPRVKGNRLLVILGGEAPLHATIEEQGRLIVDLLYSMGWTHPEHRPSGA